MPESLLVWIVLASFAFGLICGGVIAYTRGLLRRRYFSVFNVNRHIRIVRRKPVPRRKAS